MDRSREPQQHVLSAGIDKATPEGRAHNFRVGALQYLEGSLVLAKSGTNATFPAYMLVFHATEPLLKALLSETGLDEDYLGTRFGHKLVKLYDAAATAGKVAPIFRERDYLEWADEYHSKNKIPIRYGFLDASFPQIEQFHAIAQRLKAGPMTISPSE